MDVRNKVRVKNENTHRETWDGARGQEPDPRNSVVLLSAAWRTSEEEMHEENECTPET